MLGRVAVKKMVIVNVVLYFNQEGVFVLQNGDDYTNEYVHNPAANGSSKFTI